MSDNANSINVTQSANAAGTSDFDGQAIHLIDTTQSGGLQKSTTQIDESSWKKLARTPTKGSTRASVRDSLNKRKYARWNQEYYDEASDDNRLTSVRQSADGSQTGIAEQGHPTASVSSSKPAVENIGGAPSKSKRKGHKKERRAKAALEESHIDILYENQRGSFFCGIPLYSHSSLLNFDPGPWVTRDFKDSAVNITNAQVPDPSWQWDWKHWYVDMGGDVDEDGWQYSFAFFGNFAWHGSHPWIHSFVRRRRWLRKRVKKHTTAPGKVLPSSMSQAHKLDSDYFTIHPKRTRSSGRGQDGLSLAGTRPESYASQAAIAEIQEEVPDEIEDIATMLRALRMTSVDREKIEVVHKFVESGGEELVYLRDRIPEIMSLLVFQNSKRQLLEYLKQKAADAQDHRDEHNAADKPEGDAESRRINNLLKAVEAADEQSRGLEYWSDRKHILKVKEDDIDDAPLTTIFDKPAPGSDDKSDLAANIRGIAAGADIGFDGTRAIAVRAHKMDKEAAGAENRVEEKGKEKAVSRTSDDEDDNQREDRARLSPRLRPDEVLIPDADG